MIARVLPEAKHLILNYHRLNYSTFGKYFYISIQPKLSSCCNIARSFSTEKRISSNVRVRFAPSPTGNLHLGGFRTAFYNYLFAKSHPNGKFILRIEDTDQSRLVPEAFKSIEEFLTWANISPDESPLRGGPVEPYIQSQRKDIYQSYVQQLLVNDLAYKCYCSPLRLEILRKQQYTRKEAVKYDGRCRLLTEEDKRKFEDKAEPYTIRFKLDDKPEEFEDLLMGSISQRLSETEGDPIILKSDGLPIYHLANVIDDHLMGITHVIRGAEWVTSTTKHLKLYRAFGWTPPKFAHLPLILSEGKKLSKRSGDMELNSLRAQKYSAQSLLNFVTSIGGGFKGREDFKIYTKQELVDKFDLSAVLTSSSLLDLKNLLMFTHNNIKVRLQTEPEKLQLLEEARQIVLNKHRDRLCVDLSLEYIERVVRWHEVLIQHLGQLEQQQNDFLWTHPHTTASLAVVPSLGKVTLGELLVLLTKRLSEVTEDMFKSGEVMKDIVDVCTLLQVEKSNYFKLLRILFVGDKNGPSMKNLMAFFGKDVIMDRLNHLQRMNNLK